MAIATKSFIQVHQINFGNGVKMHYSIGSFPFPLHFEKLMYLPITIFFKMLLLLTSQQGNFKVSAITFNFC